MARNYQIGEAVEIIAKGEDAVAIQDLGRRYPLLVAKIAKAVGGTNADAVVEMFNFMPEYVSANKVNKLVKTQLGVDGSEKAEDDADEDVEEKPAKKAPAKKAKKASKDPYDSKDAIELFKECKKRGIKAAPKKTAKYYANLLKKADAEEAEAEDDSWEEEEEEEAPKKPAKKTAKKAKKAEPEPEEDDDDDDDDWDI